MEERANFLFGSKNRCKKSTGRRRIRIYSRPSSLSNYLFMFSFSCVDIVLYWFTVAQMPVALFSIPSQFILCSCIKPLP